MVIGPIIVRGVADKRACLRKCPEERQILAFALFEHHFGTNPVLLHPQPG
jgi:hypothetical protein